MTKKLRPATPEEIAEIREALKHSRIEMAATDRVEAYGDAIQALLDRLGHPRAIVTDESQISDFQDGGVVIAIRGVELIFDAGACLVDVIKAVREFDPAWPLQTTAS